jgi:hypothetical protein
MMMNDKEMVEMEVFRAGDYGGKGAYSEADLDALAADYSRELHEAPLTLDHAQAGPAFGWVAGLRRTGDRLVATLTGVPEALRGMIRAGAYKKRSIELIRTLAVTGRPYLRAVSLLGAATPEVKGLRDVAFAADDDVEAIEEPVCAAECGDSSAASGVCAETASPVPSENSAQPVSPMRAKGSVEAPDSANAGNSIVPASPVLPEIPPMADSDGNPAVDVLPGSHPASCPADDLQRLNAIGDTPDRGALGESRVAGTVDQAELAALREELAGLRREARERDTDAVFAQLRADGILLPEGDEGLLRALVAALPQPGVILFGGEEMSPCDWLRRFLESHAPRVPLGEAAPSPMRPCAAPDAVLSGGRVDPASTELHRRASALMRGDPALGYAAALTAAARAAATQSGANRA